MTSAYEVTLFFVKTALPIKKEGALSSTLNPISYLSACCSRPPPHLHFMQVVLCTLYAVVPAPHQLTTYPSFVHSKPPSFVALTVLG